MRESIFILTFAFFALLAGGSAFSQSGNDGLPSVEAVTVAQLKNVIERDFGNVVLVNAWATWCKPCKDEMPNLLKLRRKFQSKPFKLILVSADDIDQTDSIVRPTLKKFGVDFQTYLIHDSTDEAFITNMSSDWNGALPTSFLYDREGKLKDIMIGERTYTQFEEAVYHLIR